MRIFKAIIYNISAKQTFSKFDDWRIYAANAELDSVTKATCVDDIVWLL